jgi:hypothetical protein
LAFACAILLATLSISFTNMAEASTVLPPADQQKVANELEHDAQVMSNTQLRQQLTGEPKADPGRDHSHQHGGSTHRASNRTARPDPRGAHRSSQLVPDDTPPGPQTIERRRRHGPRLTLRHESACLGSGLSSDANE